MTVIIQGDEVRAIKEGIIVKKAAAALPQSAAAAIFNITGGQVKILNVVGEVTTLIQTQLNNTKLVANPTVGTSVDMCAVLDITADEVGCLYGITGLPSDALIGTNAGLTQAMNRGLILNTGSIDLSCSASNTGAVKWTITYVPIDDGAAVAAA